MANKTNKIRLTQEQIDYLSNMPEQGMGYQLVDIILKNGTLLKQRVVLNSTYLQLMENEDLSPTDIIKIELSR